MAAWKVSVGAVPPGGVAAAKRAEQVVEGTPLVLVLTQAARMSARVLISAVGRTMPAAEVTGLAGGGVGEVGGGTEGVGEAGRLVEEMPMLVVPAESAAKGASA